MRRADVVAKGKVLQVLASIRNANARAASNAIAAGTAHEEVQPTFELRDAILAFVEASIDNGNDPEQALLTLRQIGLTVTGALLQLAHEARSPCSACFLETVQIVVDELRVASNVTGATTVALGPTIAPITPHRH